MRNFIISVLALLSLAGCVIVPDRHYDGWHDPGRYRYHHSDYRR